MKIALITDLHFGARNDNQGFANYFQRFYSQIFFPYLKEHNIDTVVDLGDTFDRRKFISFTSLKSAKEMFFEPLAENNIKSLDDFAGLTTDDLIGYIEDKSDKNSKVVGILEEFNLTREEGDQLIMEARKIWLD